MGSTPEDHRPPATDEEGGERHEPHPTDEPDEDDPSPVREQQGETYSGISEIMSSEADPSAGDHGH